MNLSTTALSPATLSAMTKTLENNGVICYPTEAVWGLGCHPQSESAFRRLLRIKQRPQDKGVILIAADEQQLAPYVCLTPVLRQQLKAFWPGFVTCVLPRSPGCPDYLSGQFDGVAVRLTAYPVVQALCQAAGSALVSTSANLSGQLPVGDLTTAKATFGDAVDCYIDAPLGGEEKPSRIMDLSQGVTRVIRE